jgi:hypothetical protein
MSAPGRTWHGHFRSETRRPQLNNCVISDLREQVEALLIWAESTHAANWRLTEEERAFMASVSELFGVSIPLGTFGTADRAASFLRVVALALQG